MYIEHHPPLVEEGKKKTLNFLKIRGSNRTVMALLRAFAKDIISYNTEFVNKEI